ncbi:MAG: TonB-dependent receptor, partial [Alphaproteobacteria bacterium]
MTEKSKTKWASGASAAALAVAIGFAAVPAAAQVEEIIVSAQKREESLLRVPVAVTTLGAGQLETFGNLIDIQRIQALIPSLNFRRGSGNRESALVLRGIGTISFSIAAEPAVATVIDGVVLSRSGQAFNELADIARIEVLRGPQGTLFGKNASGGVINIISKKPADSPEAYMEASYFKGDEVRVKGSLSGPISDALKYRLNAFFGSFDGYIDNVLLNKRSHGYDRAGVRGMFEWSPTNTLTLTLIGDWMERNDNCCADLLSGPPADALNALVLGGVSRGIETRAINQDQPANNSGDAYGLQLNGDLRVFGDHTITSISAFRVWEDDLLFDLDFGPNSAVSGPL